MSTAPILDWTCSHCGANETLQLVKMEQPEPVERAVPALDWTCSQCGTTDTYMLVKAS